MWRHKNPVPDTPTLERVYSYLSYAKSFFYSENLKSVSTFWLHYNWYSTLNLISQVLSKSEKKSGARNQFIFESSVLDIYQSKKESRCILCLKRGRNFTCSNNISSSSKMDLPFILATFKKWGLISLIKCFTSSIHFLQCLCLK